MLLCLDIGNTHILGGVVARGDVLCRFRYATHLIGTSDQFGMFLLNILQVNKVDQAAIEAVAVSSVVPGFDYTIRHTVKSYFNVDFFTLKAGVKTGINIKYKNPNEVGADRIANAVAATHFLPNKNIIIVDMGTATTLCAISKSRDYYGGAILPGLKLGMEALKANTAKLMEVDIDQSPAYIGKTTRESIQSGLYYGQLGALKELINGMSRTHFQGEAVTVIATGGFTQIYRDKQVFDVILPDLVLQGLSIAYENTMVVNQYAS